MFSLGDMDLMSASVSHVSKQILDSLETAYRSACVHDAIQEPLDLAFPNVDMILPRLASDRRASDRRASDRLASDRLASDRLASATSCASGGSSAQGLSAPTKPRCTSHLFGMRAP
jgi:hypothetical protein